MDWDRIKGNWKQLTGSVKSKWGELTDDEIQEVAGDREKLEGKIQERYGKSKDEVRAEVDEWKDSQS
ncbi:MAG: CsbD family protein [Paracoccaceae bacterium]